ncbi:hypothetical protein [Paenibacillus sp. NPDC058174]
MEPQGWNTDNACLDKLSSGSLYNRQCDDIVATIRVMRQQSVQTEGLEE